MTIIRMPSPAENVDVVTLAAWRAPVGAVLALGAPLADLVTEKAAFTYEMETPGTLTHQLAAAGSVLPPGVAIALLDATDDDAKDALADNERRLARFAAQGAFAPASAAPTAPGARPLPPGAPIRATPAARRLAKTLGLELAAVAALHPPGILLREEHVEQAAKSPGDA